MTESRTLPPNRRRVTAAAQTAAAAEAERIFEVAPAQRQAAARGPTPTNGGDPVLERGFGRVVERIFDQEVDVDAEYRSLEDAIKLRSALDPETVRVALNDVQDNARRAHRLYVIALTTVERFRIDGESTLGGMRAQATAELQREKDAGMRSKAITEADVREKAAVLFPDEWRAGNDALSKANGMLEHMKALANLWAERSYSLGAMMGKGRS
jgi:hypothetical protein